MAEASSSKPPQKPAVPNADDVDKILAQEESAFKRDMEPGVTEAEIKKRYRTLSLFIHPDKASHPQATEAFDKLKKAESDLSNKEKREELEAVHSQARTLVLKSLSLPTTLADDDPKLQSLQPGLKESVRQQTKELLINEEVRRRTALKLNLANEGLEAKRKEEEVLQRKRKAEEDKLWEETREQRVDSWRSFTSGKKKKKAKTNVLG
ncbi:hypothetical protein FRB99_006476 [Tulasnella sp. 403]|nr:hypothetical protein FRB99_006476 [Tulasnella sp. 403]